MICSGDFLTPAPPGEKATTRQDQAGQASAGDGAGDSGDTEGEELGSEFTTGVLCGVNVKIGQPVFDSRDQRRLGLLEPALEGDEGRIIE
jgi:hypothetical protein